MSPAVLVPLCAVVGLVVGALVPPVAYRLSVDQDQPPRSACVMCQEPLGVRPTARCSSCGARLGPRRWLTALAGGVSFVTLAWALAGQPAPVLIAFLIMAGLGVLLAAIDLACLRLPDPLVAIAAAASLVLLGSTALIDQEPGRLLRGLAAAAALGAGYLLLALVPGANLGLGDVKLSAVLGLLLGWLGWPAVLLGALLPHLINGPIALGLLLTRRADRKTELPLGPALLAGALLAVVIAA